MPELPYSLMAELNKVSVGSHPPVHLWHPEIEKDIDFTITKNGTWQYLGSPIKRPRLVRLFASVLRREGDEYFLVTPVEKCRIKVEDVPFQIVMMDVASAAGGPVDTASDREQVVSFTTDMGESVTLDAAHPFRLVMDDEQTIPYVIVRDGMEARIIRNVYYRMADLLVEQLHSDNQTYLGLWSAGIFYPLMLVDTAAI